MAKFFSNIPLEKENIESLRDALIVELVKSEDFRRFSTMVYAKANDPVALIGEMDAVGNAGAGCDPTYKDIGIGNKQKRWEIGDWSIPLKICYEDLEGTIAEYSLRTGTEIGDLTGTEFMALYLDLLRTQITRMLWRLIWFGDTEAKDQTGGGDLVDGTDTTLFTVCDGFWKRLFDIVAANEGQKTAIAANEQTTFATQTSAIRTEGTATTLVDTILMDADSRINANGGAILMMNKKLADALTLDIKKTYKEIMPWQTVFTGFNVAQYNGVTIASINTWDWMINTYFKTATAWDKPFRAVYADPRNLLIGTPQNDVVSELDIHFDRKERRQYIYATGKLGTMIPQEDLVHVAY